MLDIGEFDIFFSFPGFFAGKRIVLRTVITFCLFAAFSRLIDKLTDHFDLTVFIDRND